MKLLNFFRKPKPKPKEPKEVEFEFSTMSVDAIGDKYIYKVKGAKNKKEAFKLLVEFFYGETSNGAHNHIKSTYLHVTQPHKSVRMYYGMPGWFGRHISAEASEQDREALHKYCKANDIIYKDY